MLLLLFGKSSIICLELIIIILFTIIKFLLFTFNQLRIPHLPLMLVVYWIEFIQRVVHLCLLFEFVDVHLFEVLVEAH